MDQVAGLSIAVLIIALMLPLLSLCFRNHPHLMGIVKGVMLSVYILIYLSETIFFRLPSVESKMNLTLLWSYKKGLSYSGPSLETLIRSVLDRTFTLDTLKTFIKAWSIENSASLKMAILNILLTIPLGYMLPFVWPSLAEKHYDNTKVFIFRRVVFIGFLCSLCTELAQYYFHIGLFELDDLLNNTIGCLLGCILYRILVWRRKTPRAK